jgi:hypothetical protein
MFGVMEDCICGGARLNRARRGFARIQVPVKARKVAARDFQADAMTRFENVTGGPQIDG